MRLSPKGKVANDTYCSHNIRKLSMVEGGKVIELLKKRVKIITAALLHVCVCVCVAVLYFVESGFEMYTDRMSGIRFTFFILLQSFKS